MDEEGYPDRIISKNEVGGLESFLRSQKLDYPNYEEWVSGTIQQVESGDKIAFGFFTSAKDIVGDGIIRITASKTVELKNFFIHSDYRKRGYGPALLEYI
jgi:GNAT superfamily N-acetyltransferase